MLYHIVLCYIILYYGLLYHIILYYVLLYHIILYFIIVYYIISYYIYNIIWYYMMLNNIMWYYVISYESIWYVVSKKLGNQLQQIQLLTVVWNIIFPIELAMNAMNELCPPSAGGSEVLSQKYQAGEAFMSCRKFRGLNAYAKPGWRLTCGLFDEHVPSWVQVITFIGLQPPYSRYMNHQRERKPTDYGMVFYQKITKR